MNSLRKSDKNADQERWGWQVYVLALVVVGFVFVMSTKSPPPPALGVTAGRLTPPSGRPNTVSSQAIESELYVPPLRLEGTVADAKGLILEHALKLPRTRLYAEDENYLRFESRTAVWRFVDDLEFYFDSKEKLIHVRSGSRCGFWDLGVNRRRVESLYSILPLSMTSDPRSAR